MFFICVIINAVDIIHSQSIMYNLELFTLELCKIIGGASAPLAPPRITALVLFRSRSRRFHYSIFINIIVVYQTYITVINNKNGCPG